MLSSFSAQVHSPSVGIAARARVGDQNVVVQDPPLGTGHAVLAARDALADFDGQVIITYADCPLMSADVLLPVFEVAQTTQMVVLGFEAADPGAYGRLVISQNHNLYAIVEAKEANKDQLAITACNSGVLACDRELLFSLLAEVTNDNAKGEYYLTDVVALARKRDLMPQVTFASEQDVGGVNSQGEPDVFLFDEPLSNLDASLRGQVRVEIAHLHRKLEATSV